jgi:hypothetical protein
MTMHAFVDLMQLQQDFEFPSNAGGGAPFALGVGPTVDGTG